MNAADRHFRSKASRVSFFRDRLAVSARIYEDALFVVTGRGSVRPSGYDAEVTALSRMKPKRRSITMRDL